MSDQRHPYADHPVALILADHRAPLLREPAAPARCGCGWTGPDCDHPAHLTDMLHQAGLLADGTPPETPTERVLTERGRQEDDDMSTETADDLLADFMAGPADLNEWLEFAERSDVEDVLRAALRRVALLQIRLS